MTHVDNSVNKKKWLFLFISVFLYCSLFIKPAISMSLGALNKPAKSSRINITSDSLVVNNKNKTAVFSGNVVAIKGKLKILSDVLHVLYTKNNKINLLIATGNVHIIKDKDNITGGKAVYHYITKIAVITVNPVAYQGKNKVVGKKIIINFKTGVSTIIGGPKKRVDATVYSNKSLTAKPEKNLKK